MQTVNTGRYDQDCAVGRAIADSTLERMDLDKAPCALSFVAGSIVAQGGGIQAGFFQRIAESIQTD